MLIAETECTVADRVPLSPHIVVDLDGTLTPSDTLWESVISLLRHSPFLLFALPIWLLKGRSHLKARVAAHSSFSADLLPINPELLQFLKTQKQAGRQLVLATAAHQSIADRVAARLAIFDAVLASDAALNLKGTAKLAAVQRRFGTNFCYAGDSSADLPIWAQARSAVLVGVADHIRDQVALTTPVEREFIGCAGAKASKLTTWARALRVHQWMKNLLVLVPAFTSFSIRSFDVWLSLLTAFLAFSFLASSTYIFNDLLDLNSDRAHPRKRMRPFACAELSIPSGLAVAMGLLVASLVLGLAVDVKFAALLGVYLVTTVAYSLRLKRVLLLDVVTVALLYTVRVLAGGVAVGVALSAWLLAFSVFVFVSLALVKRCAELVSQGDAFALPGRDYKPQDLAVLWPMGVSTATAAVVVFGLFINAAETRARYANPELLWVAALLLLYWLGRLWLKTGRGEMHDDPLVFAARDAISRRTILAIVFVFGMAYLVPAGSLL